MPYANVEDRRRRARDRRAERLDEFRDYDRCRYRERKEDPRFLEARRERAAERKRAKAEAVNAIKIERGCADCGYDADPIALDFDHIRGEKTFAIADTNRGLAAILAEIEKCDVVCANCHRIRTRDRGEI